MATLSALSKFGTKHVAKGIGRLTPEVLASGSGSHVTTTTGRRMLDFTSGIGVTNLGHCHPGVTSAAQAQVGTLVHGQVNIAFQKPYLDHKIEIDVWSLLTILRRNSHCLSGWTIPWCFLVDSSAFLWTPA